MDRFLGTRSRLERSSTDANIPLSQGIPAIAIGGGGKGSGSHTLAEWYDPTGRELGLKRVLLTSLRSLESNRRMPRRIQDILAVFALPEWTSVVAYLVGNGSPSVFAASKTAARH